MNMVMKLELKIVYYMLLIYTIQNVLSSDFPVDSKVKRPIVKVQQGKLQGIREKNVDGNNYFYSFRGIPYAKPPVGKLRFKDPETVGSWSEVKDATKFGNVCAQFDFMTKQLIGSDNCLYLNVYTTQIDPKVLRSVMVWVHGGGFLWGSGNDDSYGPDYLVQKDVVLVTLNYRIGILGFLNLDDEEAPGNQGLKDLVMALRWVHQNIDKFGGDPNSVTIFGESSGAASVHYLTVSPLTKGLFHRVILQSGVGTNPWARTSQPMKDIAEKIASYFGNRITETKKLIKFLQSVDAISLVDAVNKLTSGKCPYVAKKLFAPSVDSKSRTPFLNISINEAVKSAIRVPLIIGYTSHEGIFIIQDMKNEDYAEIETNQNTLLIQQNERKFLEDRNLSVSDVKKFFMGDNKISRSNAQKFVDLVGAEYFTINIHEILEIQSNVANIPVYLYKFDHYSKETAVVQKYFGIDLEGTSHTEELYYLFNAKRLKERKIEPPTSFPTEKIIKQRLVELWTNFAKTGNPNLKSELIPIEWRPINNSIEYNCLKISEDLKLIKETNILYEMSTNSKKNEIAF